MPEQTISGLDLPVAKIEAFCRRWNVSELALFGSALRSDFGAESDVDLLVSFEEGSHRGLFDMVRMQDELADIFERPVDLVSRRGLESSSNYLRRNDILKNATVVYGK